MKPPDHDKPKTFWADRFHYARERTAGMLTTLKESVTSVLFVFAATAIGVYYFGGQYLESNVQGIAVEISTILLTLVIGVIGAFMTFLAYYAIAPSRLWARDQHQIADLEQRLTPLAKLSFVPGECVRIVPEGNVSLAEGGKRWCTMTGSYKQLFVKCTNVSETTVVNAFVEITSIKRNCINHPSFFTPIVLQNGITLRKQIPQYVGVLIHKYRFGRPYVDAEDLMYDYNLLFDEAGEYEISLALHADGTPTDKLKMAVNIRITQLRGQNGKDVNDYDIFNAYEVSAVG